MQSCAAAWTRERTASSGHPRQAVDLLCLRHPDSGAIGPPDVTPSSSVALPQRDGDDSLTWYRGAARARRVRCHAARRPGGDLTAKPCCRAIQAPPPAPPPCEQRRCLPFGRKYYDRPRKSSRNDVRIGGEHRQSDVFRGHCCDCERISADYDCDSGPGVYPGRSLDGKSRLLHSMRGEGS